MQLWIKLRRAQPLLGTLVDISVDAASHGEGNAAIEFAFESVRRVHNLMSFHESESDVSRLNREGSAACVSVDPWTYEVLAFSAELSLASRGLFDICVGENLVEWGYLPDPRPASGIRPGHLPASFADIILLGDSRVSFRRPLTLDLGGVAKGFAVDRAVDALRASGIASGVVNAGGDLRVFGSRSETVHIRVPDRPSAYVALCSLTNGAVATSSPAFSMSTLETQKVSPLLHGRSRSPTIGQVSVSVRAASCMVADGLTKVLMTEDSEVPLILERYGAVGFTILDGEIATVGVGGAE